MIAEMVARLLFEMHEPTIDPNRLKAAIAEVRGKRSVEEMYHEPRVRLLKILARIIREEA
jgi:hypothetical protein